MYIPPAFAEQRLDVLHEFMIAHPFVTLVTRGAGGLIASHVPVVLLRSGGEFGTIQLHLAKPNPQCDDLAAGNEALAIFQGPHAYISPTWYVTKAVVPTWNYVAVHAYGTPRAMDDDALHQHLNDLVKLRRAIVGFEIPIARLEGKWKLGQNRAREDRLGAIAGLRTTGGGDDAIIADLMTRTIEP